MESNTFIGESDIVSFMQMEDIYDSDEWKTIIEEERKQYKALQDLKAKYYQDLKSVLNTRIVWRHLNESGKDTWEPVGVFGVSIVNRRNGYYNRVMPHLIIEDDKYRRYEMHHQKENSREFGTNHIFLVQWSSYPCEDCYTGFIAFPLTNRKYFLVSFS